MRNIILGLVGLAGFSCGKPISLPCAQKIHSLRNNSYAMGVMRRHPSAHRVFLHRWMPYKAQTLLHQKRREYQDSDQFHNDDHIKLELDANIGGCVMDVTRDACGAELGCPLQKAKLETAEIELTGDEIEALPSGETSFKAKLIGDWARRRCFM